MKRWSVVASVLALVLVTGPAVAQEALRPEVGKPLQAAQEHVKAQRFKEALAKVREAEAVSNKTAAESAMIERMRLSAALGAGDNDHAVRAFEALVAAGRLPQADQLKLMESIAGGYYRSKNNAKALQWAQRYLNEGGSSPAMRQLVMSAQFESGDFAGVARQVQAEVAEAEKAGRTPAEDRLKLLAYAQQKLNDDAGYAATLERLVAHHPKKEYWADLIARVQRKPGLSDRYALDIYRLKLATGNLTDTTGFMEMAQLAVQAGYPAEAKKIVEQGYASGALGQGPEAARHKRLADLVDKSITEEQQALARALEEANASRSGDPLVAVGYKLVTQGQAAKGVGLIEQGIAKGQLKRPEDAQLRLGLAQLQAGQKAKAVKTLRAVKGADGTADIARLYALNAG
jgi:hypothetical protein